MPGRAHRGVRVRRNVHQLFLWASWALLFVSFSLPFPLCLYSPFARGSWCWRWLLQLVLAISSWIWLWPLLVSRYSLC